MIVVLALAWTVTAWFTVLGIASLVGLVRSAGWVERVSYGLHLLMCLAMAIMPWSWSMSVPAIVWIVVFTLAGLWYLWLALFRPHADAGPGGGHHSGALLLWYHAVMMAAMVWMSVLMTMMMDAGGMGHMHGMSGMDMGDMGSMVQSSPMSLWSLAPWAIVVTLAFVAVFAAATIWFFVRLLTEPARPAGHGGLPTLAEILLSLAMAIGMGASFFLMT